VGISGYVPVYNAAATVLAAVESLRMQEPALGEVFAVDDGSTDGGADLVEKAGVRVIRQSANLGRGAARRRAMVEASHEFVLCCDAANVLPADFLTKAMPWFDQSEVAAVYGRISQIPGGNTVRRWRGRHLFKTELGLGPARESETFSTYGAVVRRSAVEEVGNYDPSLRHTEDAELGRRLIRKGWKIINDPRLVAYSIANNNLAQVLERYSRWYGGVEGEPFSLKAYLKNIWFSIRCMAAEDLAAGDPKAAGISLLAPHAQLWRRLAARGRSPE
jgi:glycosyltransferase involved in cell wall biosynthesis